MPYPENNVFNALQSIFPGNAPCGYTTIPEVSSPLRCYISVSPVKDATVIYYDHWEDGYENDLSNPTQSTTQVWGDNDPSNGIPPGFSTDIINSGSTITLQNNINPYNLTLIDYDARDKLSTTQPIGVTKSHWASGSETLMAATLLAYPTSEWGLTYRMPLGENVNTGIQSFSYTGLSVMAQMDNTQVSIDANNDDNPEINIILNEGESYFINGGVIKGATVSANQPVQVFLTTGDRCDTYESRWFNVIAQENLDKRYFGPLSGTDKLYAIYNPNSSGITVRAKSTDGNLPNISLAPNAVSFVQGHPTSGYEFWTSDGSEFQVLALSDASGLNYYNNKGFDWGATLLPEDELTQVVIIGWAPGQDPNYPVTENSAPVWMTVSNPSSFNQLNATVSVCVDFNGDDAGAFTDVNGRNYDAQYTMRPLESTKIYDPDGNQTNMVAWVCDESLALISAVYGEDASIASPGSPGLDLGAGIPGVNPFYSYKNHSLYTDQNSNNEYNIGDVVEYSIGVTNEGLVRIVSRFRFKDEIPDGMTYVPNSTVLTTPSGTTNIADKPGGTFPLINSGYVGWLDLQPGEEAIMSFRATITSLPDGDGCFTNTATVSSSTVTYYPSTTLCATDPPEICGNGIDDDGDGNTDCDDDECFAIQAAGGQFCVGNTINLSASGGTSYSWSGPNGFTSSSQNPSISNATFVMSGNYTVTISNGTCSASLTVETTVQNCNPTPVSCTGASCLSENLISGGTFESFNAGSPTFTSDLTYFTCGVGGGMVVRRYSVTQSAKDCRSNWIAAPDATLGTGDGHYFVMNGHNVLPGDNLNGNGTSGDIVCFSGIPVNANSDYCYSAQLLNICSSCAIAPNVNFMVNGVEIGTVTGSAIPTNAWGESGFSFNTSNFGNPSTLQVCLAQGNFAGDGVDLGIDDVVLKEIKTGTVPVLQNDVATSCTSNDLTINVLANDAGYVASTLSIVSQPDPAAGSVEKSGNNLVFSPQPGFKGTASFAYSVCGAASNGCCETATVTVTIAPVSATATNNGPSCTNETISLTASGGNTYSWSGPSGFSANTAYATIPNATIGNSGTYTVTVSNTAGCSATATTAVTVQVCPGNRDPECDCN